MRRPQGFGIGARVSAVVAWLLASAAAALLVNLWLYTFLWRAQRKLPECEAEAEILPLLPAAVAFAREVLATWVSFLLYPLSPLLPRALRPSAPRAWIALVPGWAANRAALGLLAYRFRRCGFYVECRSYGPPCARLPRRAAALCGHLEALAALAGGPLFLVAFGAGGLIARLAVCDIPSGVHGLIAIGTAHGGTEAAPRFLPVLRELRPESRLVQEVTRNHRGQSLDRIALHSAFDATVLPPEGAYWAEAYNIRLRDTGHYTLLYSRKAFELLLENIDAELERAATCDRNHRA